MNLFWLLFYFFFYYSVMIKISHDLIHLPTAPSAHKNTITNLLFHRFDQLDHLISLITWCTRLTPSNRLGGHINVCSELLHLHGYVSSYAWMFDKEEAYKNQPQGRRWYQGRSDGCKDAPMHDCGGPIHARLTSFSSGRDKWKTRDDELMIQWIKVNFLR